ncbi:MAG TPA: hypothetical protein VMW52_06585, partial [Phycisphaerae bacterium]|nr:hypothetical protein [Phycisphaerae bacterium]
MAAKKNAEEEVKNETETKNTPEKSLNALHKKVDAIGRFLETMFKFDIDGDGKIGCSRVGLLALTSAILFGALGIVALAGEDIIATWPAQEGNAATVELWADNGDDTADKLQISMDEDGSAYFSIGGTNVLVIPPSAGSVGTATQATVSATTVAGIVNKTVLTLDDVPIVVTDLTGSTNSCGGTLVYNFPEGMIYVLGFMVENFTFATNSVIDNAHGGDFAFGTTVGTGPDLSTTEIDLTDAKVSIDTITNVTDALTAFDTVAESYFDGTATSKDIYVNVLLDGGDIDA